MATPDTLQPNATVDSLPFTIAHQGKRFAAYVIDTVILNIVNKIVGLGLLAAFLPTEFDDFEGIVDFMMHPSLPYILASLAVSTLVIAAYFIILEGSALQGTVGKRLLGLKVCDRSGERLSFGQTLLRSVVRTVFIIIPLFVFIDCLVGILSKPRHQALHDRTVNAFVVIR